MTGMQVQGRGELGHGQAVAQHARASWPTLWFALMSSGDHCQLAREAGQIETPASTFERIANHLATLMNYNVPNIGCPLSQRSILTLKVQRRIWGECFSAKQCWEHRGWNREIKEWRTRRCVESKSFNDEFNEEKTRSFALWVQSMTPDSSIDRVLTHGVFEVNACFVLNPGWTPSVRWT